MGYIRGIYSVKEGILKMKWIINPLMITEVGGVMLILSGCTDGKPPPNACDSFVCSGETKFKTQCGSGKYGCASYSYCSTYKDPLCPSYEC